MLPLAKLCAMVTMQKRGESSVQTFSLPLSPVVVGGDQGPEDIARVTSHLSSLLNTIASAQLPLMLMVLSHQ